MCEGMVGGWVGELGSGSGGGDGADGKRNEK